MLGIGLTLLLFLMITAAITYFGYRAYVRPVRVLDQIGPAIIIEQDTVGAGEHHEGWLVKTIRHVGEKVPISPQDATIQRRYLIAAGYRSTTALTTLYGIKVLVTAALAAIAFWFRAEVTDIRLLQIMLVIGATLAGWFGPNLVLERLVKRRQDKLRLSLPDALDLMVVAVEAGLGLDQAMQNVAKELALTHPEITDEFNLVTLEMRAGKRRADALHNLAERTGQIDVRQFVGVLVQTDRFGTSLAESLRTHSDFLRVQRRQEAEERANKVGVKLVFPIFFCILPSMFLVTGGPAVLQIFKQLRPMFKQITM